MRPFRTLTALCALALLLPRLTVASPVSQVVRVTDTAGNPVSGVSFSVGATALTAGAAATTLPATNLDTGAALANQGLTYYDPGDGTGEYVFRADPASAELHFAVTASKSGVTLSAPTFGVNFFADPTGAPVITALHGDAQWKDVHSVLAGNFTFNPASRVESVFDYVSGAAVGTPQVGFLLTQVSGVTTARTRTN